MDKAITYVGLDAHKNGINVALLPANRQPPIEWQAANEPRAIRRLAKRLQREAPGAVRCCYEAGPCGYALQRQLVSVGVECVVIAPSLIPVKPGERIKTDRRDARKLAELLRAGLLTEVHPPTEAEEAARDLCRCREDATEDLTRSRHRLSKMLLRRGMVYSRRAWTKVHREWLRQVRFPQTSEQVAFDQYLLAVEQLEDRKQSLDDSLAALAQEEPYREPAAWLRCFRGINTTTAMTILTELHDFRRFQSPRQLMAYLGLVPSEHSSSDKRRQGSITKAGNSHVRRVLVEAAWHYQHSPRVGDKQRQRRVGQPAPVIALADRAATRLCRRYRRLCDRGKPKNKAVVAVARDLVGFIWALLRQPPALGTT